LQFDLTNVNHPILPFREIAVIELNPLRYLGRFHQFFLVPAAEDSVIILARMSPPNSVFGDTKIYIAKHEKIITDIFSWSANGDLSRRVAYRKFIDHSGQRLPTEIAIDFAAGAHVIQETYRITAFEILP
jgi:hypothetical protein